jgi:hypothetical protein
MKTKNMKLIVFLENNNSDKETSATGRTTPRLQPPKRDQAQTQVATYARGNRFGFRQNVVRPASGITPKFNEFDNVNNNVAAVLDNDKRRSKSATAPTRSSVAFAQPLVTTEEESSYTNAR